MEDTSVYEGFVDVIKKAKDDGIQAILVFKPNTRESNCGEAESPDMIVCTSDKPEVIAALLGNYPVADTINNITNNTTSEE